MGLYITLKNPKNGTLKRLKVGFSWLVFLFSPFLGIPLIIRGLYLAGFIFIALIIYNFYLIAEGSENSGAKLLLNWLLMFLLSIAVGFQANGWHAKRLLKRGWKFTTPDSDETRFAIQKWKLKKLYPIP